MNRETYRIIPYSGYNYPINAIRPIGPDTPVVPSHPPYMIFTEEDAINRKYDELIRNGVQGYPITPVSPTQDGGFYRHYRSPYGDWSIYYHHKTNAHYIQAPFREKWASLGWERSPLGYPISDCCSRLRLDYNAGFYQYFQNGIITYITMNGQNTIAAVWGTIWKSYKEYTILDFGYPVSDEKPTANGLGGYIYFRPFNVSDSLQDRLLIYKKGHDRAYSVYPGMRAKWQELGGELGSLGFPISEEEDRPGYNGGTIQRFEGGSLIWTPSTGTYLEGSTTPSGPSTQPPQPTPSINLELKYGSSGDSTQRYLKISGSGYKANENVNILISKFVNDKFQNLIEKQIQANTNGAFSYEQLAVCVWGVSTKFVVRADGEVSGKSNEPGVSC
ncbi:LGFP repeat-containing protein [Paenibacillus polymyxa]|uniref:LGFP repeat-containing protein n=1 Tax=Paenibacillus polymyxa TaxID=1406 RepID=UPI003217A7B5